MELNADERREKILKTLISSKSPITASALAREYSVSRQIVVGDVAILRASGYDILATPKGYVLSDESVSDFEVEELIACNHTAEGMRDELYTIVDNGATAIDVTVEHPVYGQISGNLRLSSRYDVDTFIKKFQSEENIVPMSVLTQGAHLHRIGAPDHATIDRVRQQLQDKGILMS